MKPICFIAARGGSKGVPRKNIKKFAGKPLIAYTIEKCINSQIFSHVIISTEDDEIAKISKKYGAEVPFMRPKKLATDQSGTSEVLLHGIKKLENLGYKFDEIVLRDCTVPFIRNEDVLQSVKKIRKEKSDAIFGVYRQHLNPYFNMMEINSQGYLKLSKKLTSRPVTRQGAPIVYQLSGLWVLNTKQFLKYGTLMVPRILPYEIPLETGFMIDTELEFKIGEFLARKNLIKD
jgi:N-acylneuraminate cytidylyltransferase/CMP-N,N'-diacetyllegionaminic acid synthase